LWPYAVHHGQLYRIITSAFLHENIEHILLNMITLAIVGPPVEAELGKVRFTALYLVCALGGSVGSYLLSPQDELGLGASGAIVGLMGAYFFLARRRGWDTTTILALIVINLLFGFTGGIDWRDHLGGLVTGSAVALGMAHSVDLRRAANRTAEVATGVATTLAAVGVLGLLLLLPPGHVNL
jgi:membrane associated rhomboid family serine protease